MIPRAWAGAGLLTGVIAGAALVAAVALAPDPRLAPASTPPPATPSPSAAAAASSAPPASPTPAPPSPSTTPSASGPALMHVGQPAPVLALQVAGGSFSDLQERRGKPVWVIFVTTGCASCVAQVQAANGFLARYAANGLSVLAVDVKEDAGTVSAWAKRAGATFPVLLDLDGGAAKAWGVAGYPSHYWIDAAGVIQDAAQGPASADLMAHGLAQVLPGVTVTP